MRTDTNIQPISSVPKFGAAGSICLDPDFGSRIIRVTDGNSDPQHVGFSYVGGVGGSGDLCQWNKDSTRFFLDCDYGASHFSFDPGQMQSACLQKFTDSGVYSFAHPDRFFTFGVQVNQYDLTDPNLQPQILCDFSPLLPKDFSQVWKCAGGVDVNDTTFLTSVSAAGQGTGSYVLAYQNGIRYLLDTSVGILNAEGIVSSVPLPDRFTIHNVKLTKSGKWAILTKGSDLSPCSATYYLWQVGGALLLPISGASGHFTEGFSTYVAKQYQPEPKGAWEGFQYAKMGIPSGTFQNIIPRLNVGPASFDGHPSWHNANSCDDAPFFDSTWAKFGEPFTCPWQNEVIAVRPTDGTVFRFCHNFITGKSPYFSTQYGVGTVSQDARWFLFGSDLKNTLGLDKFNKPRSDAFIVECNWSYA